MSFENLRTWGYKNNIVILEASNFFINDTVEVYLYDEKDNIVDYLFGHTFIDDNMDFEKLKNDILYFVKELYGKDLKK